MCGDWKMTQDAKGCLTRERVTFLVPDGVYTNPTIKILDGCIAEIEPGGAVIQSRPEPCQASAPGGGGGGGAIEIEQSVCNLLQQVGNAYRARVFMAVGPNSPLSVTGCGTQAQPFVLNFSQQVSGYSRNTCGFDIRNGVIFGLPATIPAGLQAGVGIRITTDPNTCVATIEQDTDVNSATAPHAISASCVAAVKTFTGRAATTYRLLHPANPGGSVTITTDGAGVAVIPATVVTGLNNVTVNGVLIGAVLVPAACP
jgi:hypothetical protein